MSPPDLSQYRDAFEAEVRGLMKSGRAAMERVCSHDLAGLDELKRCFHTLAGTAALMGYTAVSARCRVLEQECRDLQERSAAAAPDACKTWSVDFDRMEAELLAQKP